MLNIIPTMSIAELRSAHNRKENDEIYHLIEEQLKHESPDIGLWLSLAIIISLPPFADEEKSIACLQKVLALDENNVMALLILAYVYEHELGGIDDELLLKIESLHTDSDELNSMLKYVASWSYSKYKKNDLSVKEKLLKASIQLCDNYVWNYVHLAKLYFDQGRDAEAHKLAQKAMSNVQKVYSQNAYEFDATDVNEYISAYIKGIYVTDIQLNIIKELLDAKKA